MRIARLSCPHCGNNDVEHLCFCEVLPTYYTIAGINSLGEIIVDFASGESKEATNSFILCLHCKKEFNTAFSVSYV